VQAKTLPFYFYILKGINSVKLEIQEHFRPLKGLKDDFAYSNKLSKIFISFSEKS
jgi:hypothetical protein